MSWAGVSGSSSQYVSFGKIAPHYKFFFYNPRCDYEVANIHSAWYNIDMKIKAKWNAGFREINEAKNRYLVYYGSAGSGKSVNIAQKLILRILSDPGRNLVCIRKAEITNRDSTFAELNKAIGVLGLRDYFTSTGNPMRITCVNGNVILFRGVKDEMEQEKLKSITVTKGTITDFWLEEATELTADNFEIIDDRLRGILPEGLFYQIHISFNPVSATHWLKQKFFDHADPDVVTNHSTYLTNRFIDEAYHRRMMRRKKLDPEGYKIYGLGEWGELRGQIFKNYEIKRLSLNFQDYDDVAIGQDFGFNHANAILTLGFKDDDIYVLNEVYVHELHTADIISRSRHVPKDPYMYCDSAEPDRIKEWGLAGWNTKGVKKGPGSVKAQIDWLKQRKIYIHPSCTNTAKEISQWKWKYDSRNDIELDEPVGFFDDAMAALRYGVEGWRKDKTIEIMDKYGGR